MKKWKISTIFGNIAAWIASLTVLLPMLVVLLNSFKTQKESVIMDLSLPQKFMFENYAVVVERGKLLISFKNSAIYAVCSVILILLWYRRHRMFFPETDAGSIEFCITLSFWELLCL